MIISLGASGVSHAVTWPVIISRWFRRNRGLATGLAVTGPIFGSPIVILNAQIVEAHGWRVVLIGYGILILVGVTLLSMLVRDRPEPYGLRPDGDPPEEGASAERPTGASLRPTDAGLTLRDVLRTKEFWLFTSYLSGTFAVNSAVQGHMIPLLPARHRTYRGLGGRGHVHGLHHQRYRAHRRRLSAGQNGLSPRPGSRRRDDGLGLVVPPGGGGQNGLRHIALRADVRRQLRLSGSHARRRRQYYVRHPGHRKSVGHSARGPVAAGVIGPFVMGMIFDLHGNYSAAIWGLIVISALMVPLSLAMASPAVLAKRIGAARRL